LGCRQNIRIDLKSAPLAQTGEAVSGVAISDQSFLAAKTAKKDNNLRISQISGRRRGKSHTAGAVVRISELTVAPGACRK
jgi:hypothetical protein